MIVLLPSRYPMVVRVRVARKAHACRGPKQYPDGVRHRLNGAPIPPDHHDTERGEAYVEDLSESLPWEPGWRYCGPCAVAAGLAVVDG